MTTSFRALCTELADALYDWRSFAATSAAEELVTRARAALAQEQQAAIGPEWEPCHKLPITVHVRAQRPGEAHVSTREGITPVRPDDLIMRGVEGEEYPIGRELFNRTYRMGAALAQEQQGPTVGDIDTLAAIIRQVDGNHRLGASALAEAILSRWGGAAPQQGRAAPSLSAGYIDTEHSGISRDMLKTYYSACLSGGGTADEVTLRGLRAVLARWGGATPQPVASSERLPEPADCDEEGRCWWLKQRSNPEHDLLLPTWHLQRQGPAGTAFFRFTHWLPANALPLPEVER